MGTSKLKTANKVFARLSFSDIVMSRDELFATQDEVCSCDFMITGYDAGSADIWNIL